MAEIDDRLAPKDGLNNYHIVLSRMDLPAQGGGLFTFALTGSMVPVAEIQVSVPAAGQSLDRMTVEAHDMLIDILRQLTFRVDRARANHDRHASRPAAPPPFRIEPDDDMEFVVDRRRLDRRVPELDHAETAQAA